VTDPTSPEPATASPGSQRTELPAPPDSQTVPLTLLAVPARQGVQWVRDGFAVFFKRPLALAGLFAMFLFVLLVLAMLPLVGPVLLLGVLPLASLGFMLATQAVVNGKFPLPVIAAAPLRTDSKRRFALLQLGFAYALASFLIMALSHAADGGKLGALQDALAKGNADSGAVSALLSDGQLRFGLAVRLALAAALSVPFWHAPALVHWGGQGVMQALFSSTLACWRNKGAFVVYALAWGAAIGLFVFAASFIGLVFGSPQLMSIVAMPAVLMFSTMFYASLYFTFVDCFGRR
jgi:hypothetical protein